MADNLKVSMADLVNATQALGWLGEQRLPNDRILPLIRARRVAQGHVEDFSEARNAIVKRYIPEGQKAVPPEKAEEAGAEIALLLAETVEVPDPGLTWEMTKALFEKASQLEPLLWLIGGIPEEGA